jgi:hypothetical protein
MKSRGEWLTLLASVRESLGNRGRHLQRLFNVSEEDCNGLNQCNSKHIYRSAWVKVATAVATKAEFDLLSIARQASETAIGIPGSAIGGIHIPYTCNESHFLD